MITCYINFHNFTQFNQDLQDLNDRWSLQGGLQAAVFHSGSLVYANSFGNAVSDNTGQILMQNHHQMRIASLSKAITAAAIQTLVVSGDITLNDKMIDLVRQQKTETLGKIKKKIKFYKSYKDM